MTKREKYDRYDDHLKVDKMHRVDFEDGVNIIVAALKGAGVSLRKGGDPMQGIDKIVINFTRDCANFSGETDIGDVDVTGESIGCYEVLCFEPYLAEENDESRRA